MPAAAEPGSPVPADLPIDGPEFAALMARLGPWGLPGGSAVPVAVAVSGGADSMALALLSAGWSPSLALIVDHGLRPEAANEAARTAWRLRRFGIPSRILALRGLRSGADPARRARFEALASACREAGLVDLLLGHHRRDQAETVLMRADRHSGGFGLAAMPALAERDGLRLLRPLLGIAPGRLRATLRRADCGWEEDPSNRDPRSLRVRLRQTLDDEPGNGPAVAALAGRAAAAASARAAGERELAEELAECAALYPEGYAVLRRMPSAPALSALLRTLSGAAYPVRAEAVQRLAARPHPATLAGCRLLPAGRLGGEWLLVREEAALPPVPVPVPVPAAGPMSWDRRFRLEPPDGAGLVAGLGDDAAAWRDRSGLPAAVLRVLPALRAGKRLLVPHLDDSFPVRFAPPVPAAGACFAGPEAG